MSPYLPCPFCGWLPAIRGQAGYAGRFALGCANPQCGVRAMTFAATEAEAMGKWNLRVPQQEVGVK